MNNFNQFTKLNPIVKAIQFELIPEGRTSETLEEIKADEYDQYLVELREKAAPHVDSIIRSIANRALKNVEYDFTALGEADSTSKEYSALIKDLTKVTLKAIESSCKEILGLGSAKIKSAEFVESIPDTLMKLNLAGTEDTEVITELFAELKGKTPIMESFLTSRITAITTWLTDRVIENFEIYKKNVPIIQRILESPISDEIIANWPAAAYMADIKMYSNAMSQDGIDAYNDILNGIVTEKGIDAKGIIMLVNEYNNDKSHKSLPTPKKLNKQILMPKAKAFTIETLDNDEDVASLIKEATEIAIPTSEALKEAIDTLSTDDVVVKYNNLHTLSHFIYDNHGKIPGAIKEDASHDLSMAYEEAATKREREKIEKKLLDLDKALKKNQYTFADIEKRLGDNKIFDTYKKLLNVARMAAVHSYDSLIGVLDTCKDIRGSKTAVAELTQYFNAWTDYRDLLRCIVRNNTESGSNAFYNIFDDAFMDIKSVSKAESKVLAYVTRKPADIAKKNFATYGHAARFNTQWVQPDGKMSIGTHTIVKRDDKFYLLMLTNGTKPVSLAGTGSDKIFVQKKGQDATTTMPKMLFKNAKKAFEADNSLTEYEITDKVTKPVVVPRSIYEIYRDGLYKTDALKSGLISETEYKKNLTSVLSLYAEFIEVYEEYSLFDIKLRPIEEYENSAGFFADVNAGNFKSMWISVKDGIVDELVDKGLAMMFLIHSKNLYRENGSKTAYDKLLLSALSEDSHDILMLKPKMFSRKATVTNPTVHKKGSTLVNRFDANGNRIPEDTYQELYAYFNGRLIITDLSKEAMSYIDRGLVVKHEAMYNITKDKRYTEDKYTVMFSIKKNASCIDRSNRLNYEVEELESPAVMALTRSEQDLIYYTITDANGKLIESRSLNVINGKDYWSELKEISEIRKAEKSKSWKYDRTFKDIRNAYISLAITEIVNKVIEHGAVIVVERIQEELKNSRDALDNTVYKSFETQLVSRLADLHFKGIPEGEPGSVTNPYQLCANNGNSYQDGIVYFVSPGYTSNVDTETGFVNVFNFNNLRTVAEKRYFLSRFESITYDKTKHRFRFAFNYDNFITNEDVEKKAWTVYAGGPKVVFNKELKYNEYIEETAPEVFAKLSEAHPIDDYDLPEHCLMDFAMFANDLDSAEVQVLCDMFITAVRSSLRSHDGVRRTYISPVTMKESDFAEHATLNLAKKFAWTRQDKDSRGEWLNSFPYFL